MTSATTSASVSTHHRAADAAAPRSSGKKRAHTTDDAISLASNRTFINDTFLKKCDDAYKQNPTNEIMRNVITMVGPDVACTSDARSQTISHQFTNTHCPDHYHALNQRQSGRCWMFAGLNLLRPSLMRTFEANRNIGFSGTYLFFYDKLERSRTFLMEILENLDLPTEDRLLDSLLMNSLSDGGYFETFTNLVNKYGLVPDTAMAESAMSAWSADMNDQLEERLKTTAFILRRDQAKTSAAEKADLVEQTLISVYNDLVKCLGAPPKRFDFTFHQEGGQNIKLEGLTPHIFLQLCCKTVDLEKQPIPKFDFKDMIVIAHLPHLSVNKLYEIDFRNVYESRREQFLNVNLRDFEQYTIAQWRIMPVWFGCDVGKHFSAFYSAIDPDLVDNNRAFDAIPTLTKEEQFVGRVTALNHAMTIVGAEFDENKQMTCLKIENSWGSLAPDEPGFDGFLYMSRKAFLEQCSESAIFKQLLPSRLQNVLNSRPIRLDRWSSAAKALQIPAQPPASVIASQRRAADLHNAKRPKKAS